MSNIRLAFFGFITSAGVLIYTALVAWVLFSGNRFFGTGPNIFGLMAFLLLFVLSATVVGTLVLGRPVILYVNGLRSSAIKLFFFTLAWLVVLTLGIFVLYVWKN